VLVEWVLGDAGREIAAVCKAREVPLAVIVAGLREAPSVDGPSGTDGATERREEVRPVLVRWGIRIGPGCVARGRVGVVEYQHVRFRKDAAWGIGPHASVSRRAGPRMSFLRRYPMMLMNVPANAVNRAETGSVSPHPPSATGAHARTSRANEAEALEMAPSSTPRSLSRLRRVAALVIFAMVAEDR